MSEYFLVDFGDSAREIILNSLYWLKTVRFQNQSVQDHRIMRTQCTNVINYIRSGNDQFTLKKLDMILTALGLAHRTFQNDEASFRAFSEAFSISASRSAYIRTIAALYLDIQKYLNDQGYRSGSSFL